MRSAPRLPSIQQSLPPGVKLEVAFDQVDLRRSGRSSRRRRRWCSRRASWWSIIFVFLRNVRSTIIPGLAIPVSIVAHLRDHVLPRLLHQQPHAARAHPRHRHRGGRRDHRAGERLPPPGGAGRGPRDGGRSTARREIGFAVIATTIALVAVFTPLAFLKGNTGRLFNEFGIAVAGSVILSGFVALTLTPMLCAKMLRVPKEHGPVFRAFERGFDAADDRLRPPAARGAAHARWIVLGGAVALVALRGARVPHAQARVHPAGGPGRVLTCRSSRPRAPPSPTPTSTSAQVEAILGEDAGHR